MAFQGKFAHSFDAKSRVIVPAKLREGLEGRIVATPRSKGDNMYLLMYPKGRWDEMIQKKFGDIDEEDEDALDEMREFLGKAEDFSIDAQGRIILSSKMREEAGLSGDVLFIGMMDRVELWDAARFEEKEKARSAKKAQASHG